MIQNLSRQFTPAGLVQLALSKPSLSLLDQCIVSGNRFLIVLLVGRLAGANSLGLYSMSVAVMILVALVQEALILRPYLVFVNQTTGTRRRFYTGSILIQTVGLISASMIAALSVSALAWSLGIGGDYLWRLALVLSLALPGVLLWEFARRFAFAQIKPGQAVIIDSALMILQIACLLVVYYLSSGLNEYRALLVVGLSTALVGSVAIAWQHQKFLVRPRRLKPDLIMNWHFGKWMFGGQAIGLLQTYLVPYLLAFKIGTAATGMLVACQTIVLLSNPVILGISNWVGPKAAYAFSESGVNAVTRIVRWTSLVLAAVMCLFWALLTVAGEWIVTTLFGTDYQGQGSMLGLLGITAVGFSLAVAGSAGLAAIHRPRMIMLGNFLGTSVAFLSFYPLVELWHIHGAALALGMGSVTTGVFKVVVYERIQRNLGG